MSYTLRVETDSGIYDLPDYQSLSFGWEHSDVGGIDLNYAKAGVNADKLHDLSVVIIYWNGEELDNSRYLMQSGNDNEDPTSEYFTITGKSILDIFRRIITRNPDNPAQKITFGNATPGFILETLITIAKNRNRLVGITHDFDESTDSTGVPWPKTYTAEYKAGTDYLSIIHDLVDKGLVEVSMRGTTLRAFVLNGLGDDKTTENPPLELRYGLDYTETPNKWSSSATATYSLIIGDEGLYAETVDETIPPGPFGRTDQSIRQSGVDDVSALKLINQYSLQTSSTRKEEFTRRVNLRADGYVPGIDYNVGDHIYDRVEGAPVRKRVLSLVVGVDEGQPTDAAIILNDKFTSREIRNKRRIDNIVGGATSEDGGGGIVTDPPDTTVPNPPTGVGITTGSYVDHVTGYTKAVATTSWLDPETNTDGTPLTDLSGFHTEHRYSRDATYSELDSWYPARLDPATQARWDRRGKNEVNNWVGADGGSSTRSTTTGLDWFFWSDTVWGTMDADGTQYMNSFPHNTITKSDPTTLNQLQGYASMVNLMPYDVSVGISGWSSTGGTMTYRTGGWGANGNAVHFVADADPGGSYVYSGKVPVTPGRDYLLALRVDPSSTPGSRIAYRFNDTGSLNYLPEGDEHLIAYAPEDAEFVRLYAIVPGSIAGDWLAASYAGVYPTDHALQSWHPNLHHETIYNEVTNPDGVTGNPSTDDDVLVARNYQTDPFFMHGDAGYVAAGMSRDDTRAYYGDYSLKIVGQGETTNGHSGVLIETGSTGGAHITFATKVWVPSANTTLPAIRVGGGGVAATSFDLPGDAERDAWVTLAGTVAVTAAGSAVAYLYGSRAEGEEVWFDALDLYLGEFDPNRVVFDGSTDYGNGYRTEWEGAIGSSPSTLWLSSTVATNYVANPVLFINDTDWSAHGSADINRTLTQFPGTEGLSGPVPEIVNPNALTAWYSALTGNPATGIAVIGDSTSETTGNISNPDLSDRAIERLQHKLRVDKAIPSVPLSPQGYDGASAYVPVGYIHLGPRDWPVATADPDEYPVPGLQSHRGAGGRMRNLNSANKAHFTATFERVRINFATSGFGRQARIIIDDVDYGLTNLHDTSQVRKSWLSPVLEVKPHTVVIEYVPIDGIPQGSITLLGADIFEGDRTEGVRVYDLSGSGKAAQDVAESDWEVQDGLDRSNMPIDLLTIMLGFNDAGRTAQWGGPVTSAEFKGYVETIISKARATPNFADNGPVLLVGQWQASDIGETTEPQENYRAVLKEIAQSDPDVAFIDLSTVMPDEITDEPGGPGLYVDSVHPSEKGHARIAEILHSVLSYPNAIGFASAQVLTAGTNSYEGVSVATDDPAPWANRAPVAAGAWIKAPDGLAMLMRVTSEGESGFGIEHPFTGTGGWQFVSTTVGQVGSGATAAPVLTIRPVTSTKTAFWVTKAIISDRPVKKYFDGDSSAPGVFYEWTGTGQISTSLAHTTAPAGWAALGAAGTMRLASDPNEYVEGDGSVRGTLEQPYDDPGIYYSMGLSAGDRVSIVAMVKADFPVTEFAVRIRSGSTILHESRTLPDAVSDWTEVRLDVDAVSGDASNILIQAITPSQAQLGNRMWVSEMTVVKNYSMFWHGTPFHGGQGGGGMDTIAWEGTPHNSRSIGQFTNSSSVQSLGQVGSLLHPAAAGGNLSEYFWIAGAVKDPDSDKAWVFCTGMRSRAKREATAWNFQRNNIFYLAEFDMATSTLTRLERWFLSAGNVQWGDAAIVKDSWLYVYGGGDGSSGEQHILRVPSSDPFGSTPEYYDGSGWVADPASAQKIATMSATGGMSGVREFNGEYIGVYVGGFMDHIDGYSAPSPEGPWNHVGTVMQFDPDAASNKYAARMHPQMDSNELGVAISYSVSGGDEYGVQFLRGPAGAPVLDASSAPWGEREILQSSPDIRGGLNSGYLFATRVRAVDRTGNASEWAYATPVMLEGDSIAPPRPSKPRVVSFFRGIKIFIDGMTAAGGSQPVDFLRFDVHASYEEGFTPDKTNIIDSIYTATGGISVESNLIWEAERFVKIVTWDVSENFSQPSEVASAFPERLSDPDLPADLIDGAKHIKEETINTEHLTVGALDDSIIPNGNMEDWNGQSAFPAKWSAGWPRGNYETWETAATFGVETDNPISGSHSAKVTTTAESSRQLLSSTFPLVPGDIYYVKVLARADRDLGADYVTVNLVTGNTKTDVNGFGGAGSPSAILHAASAGPGTNKIVIEGQVEVPDEFADGTGYPMRFGAVGIDCGPDGSAPYTTWIDGVEVRQVVGSTALANASINRAKIRYLAVDDARISNVAVGKLTAGELWADITVSARVMTAKTGQRVEMNRDGVFGFNSSSPTPVTEMRASDGGLVSRWFRTNTTGTRIEMGTYGMGANSALMSFFPDSATSWQFPPAMGFGGNFRAGWIPGIGIHAGSVSENYYTRFGMNMIGVDQKGGIGLTSGNLLDGSESNEGAPIKINAGGHHGVVTIKGGSIGSFSDGAMLRLSPYAPGFTNPGNEPPSKLSMNYGTIGLLREGTDASADYTIRFARDTEWGQWPYHQMLLSAHTFRLSSGNDSNALTVDMNGIIGGSSWDGAGRFAHVGSGPGYCTFFWDGSNVGVSAYGGAGDFKAAKTFVIDHPDDSDKYLVHAAVEGPTADVHYRGKAQLTKGRATVILPDYFESVAYENTATVVVTPISDCHNPDCEIAGAPSLSVSDIRNGQFTVQREAGAWHDDIAFNWIVMAERRNTEFDTEPRKDSVTVRGDGPYTYIQSTTT